MLSATSMVPSETIAFARKSAIPHGEHSLLRDLIDFLAIRNHMSVLVRRRASFCVRNNSSRNRSRLPRHLKFHVPYLLTAITIPNHQDKHVAKRETPNTIASLSISFA
jgi:hypothetical protein